MKTLSRFFRKPCFFQKTVCLLWTVCAVLLVSSNLYAAEPAVQASAVNFTSVTDISMTVNWIRGDGDSCIVLMKAASAVDANPADGTGYTANAVFRYGSQVGTGNCAVYSGTGTSVNVIGLNPFTVYYVAVYEFNGSGGTEDYLTPGAASSTSTIDNRVWSSVFGNPGMSNSVLALAVEGSGNLYAGGDFTTAGVVSASRIAKWDGSAWSALSNGLNDSVRSLAFDGTGNLYAGGLFYLINGNPISLVTNHTAKWDGSAWSVLDGGTNDGVLALAFDGSGNLYAGGQFDHAGGVSANKIAKWDGSAWEPLGTGMNSIGVYALAFDSSGNLYAGGEFINAGGVSVNRIAKWDGSAWEPLGTGMTGGEVFALAVDGSGNLYAGGGFNTAGGVSAMRIAKWDGSAWTALGTGMSGGVKSLAVDGRGNLYAGGEFTTAGGVSANYIAKWNGSAWSALGTGMNGIVNALAVDSSGNLYAGGSFTTAGGMISNRIALYNSVPASEPGTQASVVNFTSITGTSLTVNWTRGTGAECIVVMRPGSAVDSDPADWTGYTADAVFGNGSQIGTGNYVVYNGIGNTATVTGLTAGTTYHVAVYEFNGSGVSENYLTSIAPASGYSTACDTNITVDSPSDSGPGSLRQAITDICDGGTITFSPGLYITLSSALTINQAKSFTIDGTGSNPVISGENVCLVFNIAVVDGYSLTLEGLHITKGYHTAENGGGIQAGVGTGNLYVNNCIIDYCYSTGSGAGFYSYGGGNYTNCIVRNNTSAETHYGGGGVMMVNGGTLVNCLITNNTAPLNGGVSAYQGGSFINCTIADNTATGGLYAELFSTFNGAILPGPSFTNCLIYNTQNEYIGTWGPPTPFINCSVNGNVTLNNYLPSASISNMQYLTESPFAVGDYSLNTVPGGGIPCSNTGLNSANTTPADLAGNPRIQNSMIDIGAYESAFTLVAEPTSQASGVNFASVTGTSMTVNWTPGSGTNRIVLIKAGSAVNANPVDGATYTANAAFGSGTQIGTGNYAVYNGTGNTVTVTGLTPGLTYFVAVYEFNGTGGSENYLTSIAPASGNTTTVMIPPGNALDFDGVDDYVDCGVGINPAQFTIEAWIKVNSLSSCMVIASKIYNLSPYYNNNFELRVEPAGQIQLVVPDGSSWRFVNSDEVINAGVWTHIAATYDGNGTTGTGKIYINGVQDSNILNSPTYSSSGDLNLFLGARPDNDGSGPAMFFNGALDEVRIWNVARDCAQIQSAMNCELTGTETGLVAYYNFNRGIAGGDNTGIPAPEVTDIKGTNHGTMIGFAKTGTASNFVASAASISGTTPAPQPEINITGLGISIPDGDTAPAAADDTDFGSADAGSGSVVHTFTVENTGTGDLILGADSITVSGTDASDFTVSGITLPATITGGNSANFDVTFDPSALGLRTATVTVASSDCDENPYDFAVQGTGGNTAPVINLDPDNSLGGLDDGNSEITFTEGGSAAAVADSDAAVTDTGNAVSLTLTVTGIADGADEIITIGGTDFPQNADKTTGGNAGSTIFTITYTQSTGVFLITGQGGAEMPLADLNLLMQGITYENLSPVPVAGIRSLSFTANDGFADSLSVLSVITVIPVNDAPVIESQNVLSVNEDTPLVIQLTDLIVTDLDNTYPTGFTLTVQTGTGYTVSGTEITPAENFTGTLTVPVTVNDGGLDSNIFNLTVTVNPVNDVPEITGQNPLSVNEDTALVIQLTDLTVTDPDNTYPDGFTLTVQTGTGYTVSGTEITPAENFTGTLTVPVTVNDGGLDSNIFNLTVTVNPVNDAPVITDQNPVATEEDTAVEIHLTYLVVTDPDNTYPDGFTLTVQPGDNYTVSGTTVTLDKDFSGNLSVPVLVNDGTDYSNIFNIAVTVNPVNDAPVITGQNAVSIPEDSSLAIDDGFLVVADPDNVWSDDFAITAGDGSNYTRSGNTITPNPDFTGTLTVPVTVNDGTADSNTFSFVITVTAQNDSPLITNQKAVFTDEDTAVTVLLSDLTVTDPDSPYPDGFTLTVQTGDNYTFSGTAVTPDENFSGNLSVPVQVNDGENDSNVFNLTVTVHPVNDAPAITGQNAVTIQEDTSIAITAGFLLVADPDSVWPNDFTITAGDGSGYTRSGNIITPDLDFTGTLTVPVTVNDGSAASNTFPFVIAVSAQNDAPLITGQHPVATDEDMPAVIHLTDLIVSDPDSAYPDGFTLTVQTGDSYTVSGTQITPAENFNGTLAVSVQVNDGINDSNVFSLKVTVNPVNDVPVITGQNPLSTAEDTPIIIQISYLIADDPDNDSLTLTVMPGENYTVFGNTVTPAEEFSGVLIIPVYVNDGTVSSEIFYLTLTVSDFRDIPVITGQGSLSMAEEGELTVTLNDLTADDPDSTYPAEFTLTVHSGENYTVSGNTITPVKDFYGTLHVPVTVHDGKNTSTVFTLSVTVTNVNDPPQFTSEPVTAATEDVPYQYEITFTDADPDDSFTVTAGNLPAWLSLKDRVLSGTPGNDDTRKYEIVLTVTDSGGMKTLQSFILAVAAVNDAPVIIASNTLNTTEMTSLTVTLNDLIVEDPDSIYPEVFTMTLQPGENYTLEGHTVTPVQGFTGTLTVPVSVNDGDDESSVYLLKITVTERPEIRTISGVVTGLEKDRKIYINAVSRSLNYWMKAPLLIMGTGEQVIPYSITELKPADDYRAEISSTDYAYQVYNSKDDWEHADVIDISENSAIGVDFVLTPPAGEISGRIMFPDTAKAGQSVLIRAYSASTGSSGTAEIIPDENGAWDVSYTVSRLLHADDYTVSLSSDSYLTRYYSGDGGTGAADEKGAVLVSTRADAPDVNFVPDSGAVISGTVTGTAVSGLRAEAWSDSLDAGSGAFVSADGTYAISGLETAGDYKVCLIRSEGSPLYYDPDQAVYDRNAAAAVSVINGNAAGIDITIPEEKGISGTVRDAGGNPLSGIWIEAQAASQAAGGSAFSSTDGTYEIQGLAPVSDYRVTARPDRHSLYSPQELTGIAAGTQNADFTLTSRPVFSISGLILDTDGEPVPNVRVEISSDSLDIFVTSTDDLSGMQDLHIPNEYDIDGLPAADDYTVTARPPADSRFAVFTRTGISLREDTDMNIVLTPSFSMTGNVSDAARGSRIADARVMASSERKSFRAETRTGADGSFAIGNMPESADYSLTVTAEGYTDTEMTNLSPSGNIAAAMHSAGKISGTVTDENGSPLAGVPVEIFSQSMKSEEHFSGNVITDQKGKFAVNGLRRYSDAGNAVEDYTVIAYPENFPPAEAGNLRPDDTVNLKAAAGAEFSGTVCNADGTPLTGADVFIDIFEKQGAFVMTSDTNPDGTFSNESLRQDAEYELKFMVYSGDDLLMAQWAGNDGIGVNNQSSAAAYSPGTPLHFRFSETVQIPTARSRNAEDRAAASESGETAVRNLRPVPLEVIYTDGTVTVKWEPSLHGKNPDAGEKYYCVFNTDSAFAVSKRTAPRNRPVTVRTVTETGLTGDNADFHCHVAAVDARGQIGETRSVAFRTDTVAPLNPKISVQATTKESTVPLSLAAAGAAEVYLSNITYGQGGQWESWTPQRAWKLTDGDGMKKIYGRFRDRAGNTVNAFATTEKIPDFDPATQHKITVITGSGGSADPSGEVIVNSGDDLTISVKPDAGYGTDQVTVDGIPVRLNNAGQFTLVSIRADHVLEVSFRPLSEKTYVITASAGSYGSIIPSGKITANGGTDQTFRMIPADGYEIAEVLADGQPVDLTADNSFVFRNITGDHSISVTFR
ncbi:MAG: tandem-95 repeat protein [Desulfococcaceae bacterium]